MNRAVVLRRTLIGVSCCAFWAMAQNSNAGPSATPSPDCWDSQAGQRTVETTLAGVPAIVRIPGTVTLPPILLWHGFGPPESEGALMEALPLDEVPAIKVYLGMPMFGARRPARGMEEVAERQQKDMGMLVFAPVVVGAAEELENVVRALSEAGCLDDREAVGLFGFSAGGAATLLALAERKVNVKAAVTLNASTGLSASVGAFERALKRSYDWTTASRQLADRSDAVKRAGDIASGAPPPALLLIHGERDQMMPPQLAIDLYDSLRPLYDRANAHSRLQLAVVPNLEHTWVDIPAIDSLRARISQWYRAHL